MTTRTSILICTLLLTRPVIAHAQPQQPPEFPRAVDALERVSWRTRTLVGEERLTNWKFALPSTSVAAPTLLDAAVRADAAIVNFLEASPTQRVSMDVPKNFDYNLTSDERAALKKRLGLEEILVYRVDSFPTDAETRRRIFAFAKDIGARTILVPLTTDLSGIDALAGEHAVN